MELRLLVRVLLDCFIDVLAILNADGPLFQRLEGVGGRFAQRRIGAGLLDQPEAVVCEADLIADVVQSADGVIEGDLTGLEGAEAIQGGITDGDASNSGTVITELNLAARRLNSLSTLVCPAGWARQLEAATRTANRKN